MNKFSIHLVSLALIIGLGSCQSDENVDDTNGGSDAGQNDHRSDLANDDNTTDPNSSQSSQNEGESSSREVLEHKSSNQAPGTNSNSTDEIDEPQPVFVATEPIVEIERPIDELDDYDFHAYQKLDAFLSKYVTYSGKVNYSSIKANKSELTAIIKEFENNYPDGTFSHTEKLCYWINAYNIYTIKLIVDNYPTTSITKITAKPWNKKFIKLGGTSYSLNNLENDIIRKNYNEPRVHFALNCASKSCPVLLNKAYTPSKLYGQLVSQTKRFLSDTSKNKFGEKEVQISKIFDWYKEDFTKDGTLFDFLNKYLTNKLSDQKVSYMDYSWDLNK